MRVLPSATLRRLIRESMRPFAKRHGFAFVKRTLLGRVHEDTLHIINFDVVHLHFNCTVAIQPLYVPATFIGLSLGTRLEQMDRRVPRAWGYGETEEEINRELLLVQELLEAHALPWFAKAGTPEGIVSFLETPARKRRPPVFALDFVHDLYLGFSCLYTGRYKAGQRALAAVADSLKGDTRPWAIERRELAERMRVLARDEPDRVPSTLQEFVRETKANLKLK